MEEVQGGKNKNEKSTLDDGGECFQYSEYITDRTFLLLISSEWEYLSLLKVTMCSLFEKIKRGGGDV